ncbi:hypothetical protein C5F59_018940 [Streptomyces sp. QL37]|nr:hypothetical protein [Streptomyces sp. QL37]
MHLRKGVPSAGRPDVRLPDVPRLPDVHGRGPGGRGWIYMTELEH